MLVKIKEGHGKHHVKGRTFKAGDELDVSEATYAAHKAKFEQVLSADELLELAEKRAEDARARADDEKKRVAAEKKAAAEAAKG